MSSIDQIVYSEIRQQISLFRLHFYCLRKKLKDFQLQKFRIYMTCLSEHALQLWSKSEVVEKDVLSLGGPR